MPSQCCRWTKRSAKLNGAVEKSACLRCRFQASAGWPMPRILRGTSSELLNLTPRPGDKERTQPGELMTTKQDLAQAVIIERTFDAPIAGVWAAITKVEQMRDWYFDLKEFKPVVGFEFDFTVEHEG